jgi:hypothetical protein
MSDRGYLKPFEGKTINVLAGGDWVLDRYLSGSSFQRRKEELKLDSGPCYAQAKFACHLKGDESKRGFFRMYRQVPFNGTERRRPEERRKQAVKAPEEHSELKALLALQDCDVVPEVLAHEIGEQNADEMVPGGYFIHFV